jgi:hypothetical protein
MVGWSTDTGWTEIVEPPQQEIYPGALFWVYPVLEEWPDVFPA